MNYLMDLPVRHGTGLPIVLSSVSLSIASEMSCLSFAYVDDMFKGRYPSAGVGTAVGDVAYKIEENSETVTIAQLSESAAKPGCLQRYVMSTYVTP